MAANLKLLVKKEIARLKDNIARESSALASLREEFERHEAVYRVLEEGGAPGRQAPAVQAKRPRRRSK